MTGAAVLRLAIALVLFGLTAWAFAAGQMLLAVIGIAASAWAFWKLFLSNIE